MGWKPVALAGLVAVLLQGCAAAGLTALGVGLGVGADTGVSRTVDGKATRTFVAPPDQIRRAAYDSLKQLAMPVTGEHVDGDKRTITARAGDRKVEITVQRLTPKATRMTVVAKHHMVLRDRATADQIIERTQDVVDNQGAATRKLGGDGAASPVTSPERRRDGP